MVSKFLTAFLLLALVALVVVDAQDNSTNVIDQCIKRENCAANDRACRAACAGVPNPDPQVADNTQTCYKKCADDHLPADEKAYEGCTKDCREKVYQEGITQPGSSVSSKTSESDNGGSSGSSSDNTSESTGNDNSSDDGGNSSDNSTGSEKDSGAFSAKSVHVYVFAAVLACVAFTVGL